MKVCDVVLNSIWYDPRVRKQIVEYLNHQVDLVCIGYECARYDPDAVSKIPCKTHIVMRDRRYIGKQRSIIKKLTREKVAQQAICDAIVAEKPDIIHANDLDALIPAYMAQKILKCKLIYDSHEIYTENNFLQKKKLYASWLRIREKHICKKLL